jgi:hypothetical protein
VRNGSGAADHNQRGASRFGLLIFLLLLGLFFSMAIRIIPVYIDHNVISNVAEAMVKSGQLNALTQTEMRREFASRLRVNNIRDFDTSSVTSNRVNNQYELSLSYEKRVPLFYNIDAVLSFNEKFQ